MISEILLIFPIVPNSLFIILVVQIVTRTPGFLFIFLPSSLLTENQKTKLISPIFPFNALFRVAVSHISLPIFVEFDTGLCTNAHDE